MASVLAVSLFQWLVGVHCSFILFLVLTCKKAFNLNHKGQQVLVNQLIKDKAYNIGLPIKLLVLQYVT